MHLLVGRSTLGTLKHSALYCVLQRQSQCADCRFCFARPCPSNPQPTDVRMDGEFDVTVEKLIRHWCPTLADKHLKWVHQLDFGGSTDRTLVFAMEVSCAGKRVSRARNR